MNTCGFLDSAKAESLDAIGEALQENGKVIVTGCLGRSRLYPTSSANPRRDGHISTNRSWMPCMPLCRPRPIRLSIYCLPLASRSPHGIIPIPEDFRGLQSQVQVLHHPRMRELASRPAHAVLREAEKPMQA